MHLALEMNFDNVVIVGDINNTRLWGRSPQPPEDAEAIFYSFFQKIHTHF